MPTTCVSCGRDFRADQRFTRCLKCRELTKVYTHQLHRRRGVVNYTLHTCPLCRKHKLHAQQLVNRWNERGIYVLERCSKSHVWFRYRRSESCPICQTKVTKEWYKSWLKSQEEVKLTAPA